MSEVMNSHIRHLQERLARAEAERDEALARLRPFAEAYRAAQASDGMTPDFLSAQTAHFARAAELVPETAPA